MMLDWSGYQQQALAMIAEIGRRSPETVRGYRDLSGAGAKKDLLGAKTRELIALAVAVTRQCDGCIVVHTDAAVKHGATQEELAEALGVAIAVNAGAALSGTATGQSAMPSAIASARIARPVRSGKPKYGSSLVWLTT